jgi:hypothetical protein
MSTHRDTMRALADARPSRLNPGRPPADPSTFMAHARVPERAPRRRLVLAGAGLATVAAGVAAAVVLQAGTAPTNPIANPSATTVAPDPATAADLLLVAATRSDTAGLGGGRYWVLRFEHGEQRGTELLRGTDEMWLATRPGDPSVGYSRDPSGGWSSRPMQNHTPDNNFLLAGRPRPVAELAALPSRPEQLRAKLLQWYDGAGEQSGQAAFLYHAGLALVVDLPVPGPVRAAAYRMLAELPGIASLGRVTDALGRSGMAVAYTRRGDGGTMVQQRLIVDPATGRALGTESWTDGRRLGYNAVLKAEWSDDALPDPSALR